METLTQPEITAPAVEIVRTPSRLQDYGALSKPRVTSLVIATTAAGMVLGASPETPLTLPLFLNAMIGSWLLDLTATALRDSPDLAGFGGRVSDSGEGRWTSKAGICHLA